MKTKGTRIQPEGTEDINGEETDEPSKDDKNTDKIGHITNTEKAILDTTQLTHITKDASRHQDQIHRRQETSDQQTGSNKKGYIKGKVTKILRQMGLSENTKIDTKPICRESHNRLYLTKTPQKIQTKSL